MKRLMLFTLLFVTFALTIALLSPAIQKATLERGDLTDQRYLYVFDFDFVNTLQQSIEILSVNVFDVNCQRLEQDWAASGRNWDPRLMTHALSGDHPLVKIISKPRGTPLEQATVSPVGDRIKITVTNRILSAREAIRPSLYVLSSTNKYHSLVLRVAYKINGNVHEVSRTFTVGMREEETVGEAQGQVFRPTKYVALGDSYSSGEGAIDSSGNVDFIDDTDTESNKCHRALNAYPELVKTSLGISSNAFIFRACSGAMEAQFFKHWEPVYQCPSLPVGEASDSPVSGQSATLSPSTGNGGQWTDPAQLCAITSDVDLVTLSVGANDIGFAPILEACVNGFRPVPTSENACSIAITLLGGLGTGLLQTGDTIIVHQDKDFPGTTWAHCDLQCVKTCPGQTITLPALSAPGGLFQEIHKRAPKAAIRVLLYPRLFPTHIADTCIVGRLGPMEYSVTSNVAKKLNELATTLNNVIVSEIKKASATGIDIKAADPNERFEGHRLCDKNDPWINGVIFQPNVKEPVKSASFHPNSDGHKNLAQVIEENF